MIRTFLLRMLCGPVDVLGFFLVFLLTRGARASWLWTPEAIVVRSHQSSWLARRWRYSTTFGHVVLLHPEHNETTLRHELVHVSHVHVACCVWWLLTALSASPLLVWLSPLAWLLFYGAVCLASWLGLEHPYEDNALERHARLETEPSR